MVSKVEIFNLALGAIGTRASVSSVDEQSREAEVCRLWYDHVREIIFAASRWHSLTKHSRLALLASRASSTTAWVEGDPDPGFTYIYSAPSDLVRPRHLADYTRFKPTIYDDDTRAIATDQEDAILTYTADLNNTTLWEPALSNALIYGLAAAISMSLHGKDQRTARAFDTANSIILEARITQANENWENLETVPDWISARGYSEAAPKIRYFYPNGALLSVSNIA